MYVAQQRALICCASVRCCSAVDPSYSATALQRQTGRSQRYSAKRAPTALQRQTGSQQLNHQFSPAFSALAVYSATAPNEQITALQRQTGAYSATAPNEQTQRYSATALQHLTLAVPFGSYQSVFGYFRILIPLFICTGLQISEVASPGGEGCLPRNS